MEAGGHTGGSVLVTGADGFIGRHLVTMLSDRGFEVLTLERDAAAPAASRRLPLTRDSSAAAWREGLAGIDAVVHLAGIAHRQAASEDLTATNERWPVELFQAAGAARVSSYLWLSSIKVLGNVSEHPLRTDDPYRPADAYARSKMEAEMALRRLAGWGPTSLAIVRPPLVYGPGVTANFAALGRLARLCRRGLPLPLGAATAPRSLIGVTNLCDLIIAALGQEGIFHAADARDVSAHELLLMLGAPAALLLPVPARLVAPLAGLAGRRPEYERLFEPLQIDRQEIADRLGWQPPVSVEAGLDEVRMWLSSQ